MELKAYLLKTQAKGEGWTQRVKRFADDIDYTVARVWQWLKGGRPHLQTMELIEQKTGRKVRIQDWLK